MNWLKNKLKTEASIALFIHHLILAIDAKADKQFSLEGRDRVRKVLSVAKSKVTLFCGHYHLNDERLEGNIHQYVTLASSYQVEKLPDEIRVNNNSFGYRIIEFGEFAIKTSLVIF